MYPGFKLGNSPPLSESEVHLNLEAHFTNYPNINYSSPTSFCCLSSDGTGGKSPQLHHLIRCSLKPIRTRPITFLKYLQKVGRSNSTLDTAVSILDIINSSLKAPTDPKQPIKTITNTPTLDVIDMEVDFSKAGNSAIDSMISKRKRHSSSDNSLSITSSDSMSTILPISSVKSNTTYSNINNITPSSNHTVTPNSNVSNFTIPHTNLEIQNQLLLEKLATQGQLLDNALKKIKMLEEKVESSSLLPNTDDLTLNYLHLSKRFESLESKLSTFFINASNTSSTNSVLLPNFNVNNPNTSPNSTSPPIINLDNFPPINSNSSNPQSITPPNNPKLPNPSYAKTASSPPKPNKFNYTKILNLNIDKDYSCIQIKIHSTSTLKHLTTNQFKRIVADFPKHLRINSYVTFTSFIGKSIFEIYFPDDYSSKITDTLNSKNISFTLNPNNLIAPSYGLIQGEEFIQLSIERLANLVSISKSNKLTDRITFNCSSSQLLQVITRAYQIRISRNPKLASSFKSGSTITSPFITSPPIINIPTTNTSINIIHPIINPTSNSLTNAINLDNSLDNIIPSSNALSLPDSTINFNLPTIDTPSLSSEPMDTHCE